jgi:hypothetical protein
MKRLWLVAAAMAPLSFAAAMAPQAQAQTTISNTTTTPQLTSTTGNLTITGAVQPNTSGNATTQVVAVTINSNASVNNQGTVSYNGHSFSTAIQAIGGNTGLISNSGSISDSESTTGDDTTAFGLGFGPFANGTNRFGIQIVGPGTFTGLPDANDGNATNVIDNTGSITVTGENSAAISIETDVDGGIFDSGTITVTGGNFSGNVSVPPTDVSYGIHSTGAITGNVTITGAITATGANATGVSLEQGLSGELLLQNTITATGYRSTAEEFDPAILAKFGADQILQGGPGLAIGGDVGGGVVIDVFRAGNATTTGNSGGDIVVEGSAPALLIGGVNPLTVGVVGNSTYGLIIGGAVLAAGQYPGFDSTGIQIGGNNTMPVTVGNVTAGDSFNAVTIAGGIDISGNVSASALTIGNLTGNFANPPGTGAATALHIGAEASTPLLTVSGGVEATSAGSSGTNPSAIAIQIDGNASLTTLNNSGNISAAITGVPSAGNRSASGGTVGTAIAVNDQSGTLTTVTNTGIISATITPIAPPQTVDKGNSTIWALNLTAATPVTVTQMADPNNINGITSPSIIGDVLFGSGNATLDLEGGNLTGDTFFGNGTNSLTIGNATTAAVMTGGLSQVTGGNLSVAVNNGELFMTSTGNISVPTLTIGGAGGNTTAKVIFSADPATNATGEFFVSGNATLGAGTEIGLNLLSKLTGNTTSPPTIFTVIQAGNLSAVSGIGTLVLGQLPYLYAGTTPPTLVVNQGAGGSVSVQLTKLSAAQLGLNAGEAAAYNAIYAAFDKPDVVPGGIGSIATAVLGADTRSSFLHLYDQFLPDYGGGVFETLTEGQQGLSRAEADAPTKLQTDTTRGWVQEIGYAANENSSANGNGFLGEGFGVAGGVEAARGDSVVGVAAAFLSASVDNGGTAASSALGGSAVEAGVYVRAGGPEGLKFNADVNGGVAWFNSTRVLVQESEATVTTPATTDPTTGAVTAAKTTTTDTVSLWRQANSHWYGALMSADFGVSYQKDVGKRLYVRPEASVNYSLMYEAAHKETGGGDAFDLSLKARTSQQATVQAAMVIGAHLGDAFHWQPEVTIGWRQIVTGGPGATSGQFVNGGPATSFTIPSNFNDKSGVVGRFGVHAGSAYADFSADAGGVFGNDYQTYDARAVARFLF